MAKAYLFAGPSLPDAAELAHSLGVEVRTPIAAGDLIELRPGPDDRLGIVDGYFHQARAVPHKEIMAVLAAGARVYGTSSMGALRAVELGPWGMIGIGRVFESYRDGELVADDEVALLHGPAEDGYPHLSEPLVNIRATLAASVRAGVCPPEVQTVLVSRLAAMPYRDRSYQCIAGLSTEAGLDAAQSQRLSEFCLTNAENPKRQDALELLTLLAADPVPDKVRAVPPHRTIYLHDWQLAASPHEMQALRVCQVLAADYPKLHAEIVRAALAEECQSRCATAETDPISHARHRGWLVETQVEPPFLRCWSTPAERTRLGCLELLELFLVRSYRIKPGIAATELAMARLKRHSAWDRALSVASRVDEINELGRAYRPDFDPEAAASEQILGWLATRWEWPVAELELAAFDRGFGGLPGLVAASRPLFLAAQCDPETRDFSLTGG